MKKMICSITGALFTAASVSLIADYAVKKKKEKEACVGELVAGIVGLVAGSLIAYLPEYQAQKKLPVEDMLDDEEASLVSENISEVLGNPADRGDKKVASRTIEIDEDTTIEDFIFDEGK